MKFRDMQTEDTKNLLYRLAIEARKSKLTDEEMQYLINIELGKMRELFEIDGYNSHKRELELDPANHITGKILKTYNNQIKAKSSDKTMIVDTAFLSGEYNDMNSEDIIAYFEGLYGVKIFLINSNRCNYIELNYNRKPVYFI